MGRSLVGNTVVALGGGAVLFGVSLATFHHLPWTDDLAGAVGLTVGVTLVAAWSHRSRARARARR